MRICETCGGVRATEAVELIAGTPCRCYIEEPAFGGRENAWEEQMMAAVLDGSKRGNKPHVVNWDVDAFTNRR